METEVYPRHCRPDGLQDEAGVRRWLLALGLGGEIFDVGAPITGAGPDVALSREAALRALGKRRVIKLAHACWGQGGSPPHVIRVTLHEEGLLAVDGAGERTIARWALAIAVGHGNPEAFRRSGVVPQGLAPNSHIFVAIERGTAVTRVELPRTADRRAAPPPRRRPAAPPVSRSSPFSRLSHCARECEHPPFYARTVSRSGDRKKRFRRLSATLTPIR